MSDTEAEPSPAGSQNDVFAFLGDAATHGGARTSRCDTHAAAVFLAGERAYKVKRAVRFPFLDYSTLEKRKSACEAELDVNRRFAPELYRRVVPITRESDGRLALDGRGEVIEWAVEMMRFDETQTLDHIAGRGALNDGLSARLATVVTEMHKKAEPADVMPWLAALENYIAQNTQAFAQHRSLFPPGQVSALESESRAALTRLRPLVLERGRSGLVRRGHGDLHLGNIAVLNGEPVAFDAIEFDPVIASGDVLYDLAFLLMDLLERNLANAANIVLNGYLAATRRLEDCDGLAALPLFMSLRAAIRSKVTAARLDKCNEPERASITSSAQRYFDLANKLLRPVTPVVVCTAGLSGTGKSVLARALAPILAPAPGAVVLRSDVERKALFGRDETSRLPPEAYRPETSEELYSILNGKAKRIARAGYSVIVDAVFAKPAERSSIEAVARNAGAEFFGLFLTADLATRLRRLGKRELDASDADAAVARHQEEFDLGQITWYTVDATGTPAKTLAHARAIVCQESEPGTPRNAD
jgi:aminoglycoside phosphotransferase family enzyme/predicted kinase